MTKKQDGPSDQIRKYPYPENKFIYEKQVLIKQTNLLGNTYFANYIEWEGEAREKFLLSHPSSAEFMKTYPNILMITHSLFHRFRSGTYFGDIVRIELTSRDVLDYSLVIVFRHFSVGSNELIGEGWHKICFFDTSLNRPSSIPQIFVDLAESVKENSPNR